MIAWHIYIYIYYAIKVVVCCCFACMPINLWTTAMLYRDSTVPPAVAAELGGRGEIAPPT